MLSVDWNGENKQCQIIYQTVNGKRYQGINFRSPQGSIRLARELHQRRFETTVYQNRRKWLATCSSKKC